MKIGFSKIVLVLLFVSILNSCNNDDDNLNQNLNGNYSGIFTVEYSDGTTFSNNVTVTFNEQNNYSSSGNGNNNDFYPAGGSGTYEKGKSTIIFNDINLWLAHFDWGLILDGEYEYSINESELTISTNKNNSSFYKYELTKE